jgi:hypothetical protein
LLYVQDYVTVVPHLTEVRFGYGWKVTAYSKAGQRLRFIIFWIVNYQSVKVWHQFYLQQ